MANRPIQIMGINVDGTLQLSDSGVTTANRGDTVTWIINNNSGVATIVAIVDNSDVDVFSPDPAPIRESQNWQGTINPNLSPLPQDETYTINYTRTGSTTIYNHDPKIQVNS